MKTIEIEVDQTTLPALVQMAIDGSSILLTQAGRPVAQVAPAPHLERERVSPLHPGAWQVTEDFDEPLEESFWAGKE
jgi:antitoxin (DNA-binding transcriptional repressor) of toxin-antitoxin stability system